jgi:hypothetical protein
MGRTTQDGVYRSTWKVGFESLGARHCDVPSHRWQVSRDIVACQGLRWAGAWWSVQGLLVAGRVEGEFAQQFAGLGVDDADVAVRDEGDESFPGVLAAQTDVVEPAVVADGQDHGGVGAIASGPVVDRDRGFPAS